MALEIVDKNGNKMISDVAKKVLADEAKPEEAKKENTAKPEETKKPELPPTMFITAQIDTKTGDVTTPFNCDPEMATFLLKVLDMSVTTWVRQQLIAKMGDRLPKSNIIRPKDNIFGKGFNKIFRR